MVFFSQDSERLCQWSCCSEYKLLWIRASSLGFLPGNLLIAAPHALGWQQIVLRCEDTRVINRQFNGELS